MKWLTLAKAAYDLGRSAWDAWGEDAWQWYRNRRGARAVEAELDELRDRLVEAEGRITWPLPPAGWEVEDDGD